MDIDKVIKERHSVRKFSNKKVDWRDILVALDAARLAPLAGNIPTMRFILVSDKEKIRKISDSCQQDFISTASYVVVACTFDQVTRSYGERGKIYARQQAGAAIENFLLKLTDLGLATTWIGAFVDDQIKNILKIPANVDIEAIFPIGIEMLKGKQRTKPNLDNYLYFEKYGQKQMNPAKKIDVELDTPGHKISEK